MKYAIFCSSLIFISPVFAYFLGGAKLPALFVALLMLVYFAFGLRKINPVKTLLPLGLVFTLFSVTAIYWQDIRVVGVPVYFYFALLLCALATDKDIDGFIDIASVFMLVLCVGAVVSTVYVVLGGGSLASFPNPDGRINHIFFGTLTNSYWGVLIRPSGIYDEPGAFSFFICAVATLRRLFEKDSNVTWTLLALGLVTMSLAHIVFMIFYFFSDRPKFKYLLAMVGVLSVTFLFLMKSQAFELFQQVFLNRFEIGGDGLLKGDNRTDYMLSAIDILKSYNNVVFWGLSPESYLNGAEFMNSSGLPEIGSNPLGSLVRMGAILSSVYYFILLLLLSSFVRGKKYFAVVGFGMLLLQRDYIYVVSYSLFVVLIVRYTIAHSRMDIKRLRHGV